MQEAAAASQSLVPLALGAETPLDRLERVLARFADETALVRRGGRITEVASSHYRVRGLTASARLGDLIEHRGRDGRRHG